MAKIDKALLPEELAGALTTEEMDQINGGMYDESWQVADIFRQAGKEGMMLDEGTGLQVDLHNMRQAIQQLGFTSNDQSCLPISNTYTENSTGKVFSQEEFVDYLLKKFPGVQARNYLDRVISWTKR